MNDRDQIESIYLPICSRLGITSFSLVLFRAGFETISFGIGSVNHGNISDTSCVNQNTVFQLASVSKFLTTCLLIELSRQKLLDVNQPIHPHIIQECFPSMYEKFDVHQITWSHLLTHRSGFKDKGGIVGQNQYGYHLPEVKSWNRNIADYYDSNLLGIFHYSACGYWLIQQLLESTYSRSFATLLTHFVLKPLGMYDTCSGSLDSRVINFASGIDPTGILTSPYMHYPCCEAVAGIWSSAHDLGLLFQHLLRSSPDLKVHNRKSLPLIRLYDLINSPFKGSYQYGLALIRKYNQDHWIHTGCNPGYTSAVLLNSDAKAGMAFLINSGITRDALQSLLEIGYLLMRRFQ